MKDEYIKIPKSIIHIDELLIKLLPKEYSSVAEHYINSKIELLKTIDELIKIQIKRLEETREELKRGRVSRERVEVE